MDFKNETNRIYSLDSTGKLLAEVTFPNIDDHTVDINHTFVDDSLRGQGVANKLMELVVDQLRAQKKRAVLTCSYAVRWFDKHPEYDNLLR